MQISTSTLLGPRVPFGVKGPSARLTTDVTGESTFTEVMGSVKENHLESPSESKAVILSDKALVLANKEADEDADLSLLACWTPAELARFDRNYTEEERFQRLNTMVFNSGYSTAHDCTEAIYGGPTYYTTTRILVTPESEVIDRRQSDAFVAQLEFMYRAEVEKGSSAMDIYKKIGKLILSQPDDFAYRFGFSVKFRETVESMSQWGARGNPFEGRDDSFSLRYTPPDESDVDALGQIKGGISQKSIMQKSHDMERDRQYLLMDILYGNMGHKSKLSSAR